MVKATIIPIPGDQVLKSIKSLEALGEIDSDGANNIMWLYNFAKANSLSYSALGRAVGLDGSTINRLFTANYQAGYTGLMAKIAKFRMLTEERQAKRDIGFIETSTWRKIEAVCRNALIEQMPSFIYGASQIGKTTCLREFARRNNHGTTKYLRMPAATTFSHFIATLAKACFINPHDRITVIRDRIIDALDSRNLLIIDEFHQALCTVSDSLAAKIVEYIREIYDRAGCGIVLAATRIGEEELERGRQHMIYDQLRRRGMTKLVLPDMPPLDDIYLIAEAHGLPRPPADTLKVIKEMLATSGLGMYCKYLAAAEAMCNKRQTALTWDAFGAVWDGMRALSGN